MAFLSQVPLDGPFTDTVSIPLSFALCLPGDNRYVADF
jgi:hypothetical protein